MSHKEAADKVHKAIKGVGTDEKALNDVFGHHSKEELIKIAKEYQEMFHVAMDKDIKGDTSGHYENLLVGLMTTVAQAKVNLLKFATKGAGTAERYLIDVLAPSNNQEILDVYQTDPTVIANVVNDVSHGDFAKVVNILLKGKRNEKENPSHDELEAVAQKFYKAGEGKLGTDEATFIDIITGHSPKYLALVSKVYQDKHKHTLVQAIKGETSGDFEDVLVALTKTKHEYFADRLWTATHGLGTDDHFLSYAFAVLSRDDLKHVAKIFHERHADTTLAKQILGDVSGNYAELVKFLLS